MDAETEQSADSSVKVEEIIYGCGFNGFAQLDDLKDLIFESSSSTCSKKSHESTVKCRNKVLSPVLLFKLQKNEYELHKLTITWARIAGTVRKVSGSYTSFITGLKSSKSHHSNDFFNDIVTTASTSSDIIFRTEASESAKGFKILHDGSDNIHSVNICMHEDATIHDISGGHSDFYLTYDSISFGRVSARDEQLSDRRKRTCTGDNVVVNFKLIPIESGISIKEVSCGKEHALLLSKHGSVYSYGLGSRGQLGHCNVEAESVPRLIEALEGVRITVISAGGWHSAAVSEIGDLYTWGWNESGQLGISYTSSSDETVGIQAQPCYIEMTDDFNVSQVACGSRHTLLLSVDGKVFACGWNAYGQLGLGHTQNQDKFTEISLAEGYCVKIFAKEWNSIFVCQNNKHN